MNIYTKNQGVSRFRRLAFFIISQPFLSKFFKPSYFFKSSYLSQIL